MKFQDSANLTQSWWLMVLVRVLNLRVGSAFFQLFWSSTPLSWLPRFFFFFFATGKKNEKPLEKTTPQIVVGHERGASRGVLERFLLVNKGCSFELWPADPGFLHDVFVRDEMLPRFLFSNYFISQFLFVIQEPEFINQDDSWFMSWNGSQGLGATWKPMALPMLSM